MGADRNNPISTIRIKRLDKLGMNVMFWIFSICNIGCINMMLRHLSKCGMTIVSRENA